MSYRIGGKRVQRRRAYAALLLTLLSCSRSVEPIPDAAVQFDPPAHYALWWQMTERCSGLTGSYSSVRWYTVPYAYLSTQNGDTTVGDWYPGRNQIVLSQGGQFDPQLIRHEMLHALVNGTGHPREYFYSRCNGYVSCVGECARDAGPTDSLPQANALPIELKQLIVRVSVTPSVVSDSAYDGWFAVTVSVTNPLSRSVRLRLTTFPWTADASPTFGWSFVGGRLSSGSAGNGGYGFVWADSIGFDAGETRTVAIDRNAVALALVPATYDVRGWFNVDTAPATSFTFR